MEWRKRVAMAIACLFCTVICLTPAVTLPAAPVQTVQAATAILGDVDQNGALNMRDALMLFSYTSGRDVIFTVTQLKTADMDDDGSVAMRDALMLYQRVSGREEYPTTTVVPPTTATTATVTETTTTTTTTTTTETDSGIMSTTAPTTPTSVFGVDVSYAQGTIDWATVKESEAIDFAILRCGYGQDQTNQDDSRWEENAAACEAYDIPYGAYFFCYARNAEEARGEAAHALRLLEGKNLDLPVFLDMEDSTWQGVLTPDQYAEIATVFCETLRAAGYRVGVYSNLYWWTTRLTDDCFNNWYRWVAQYNTVCEYQGEYQLWQYSEDGEVNGITGPVDTNYCYVDPRKDW